MTQKTSPFPLSMSSTEKNVLFKFYYIFLRNNAVLLHLKAAAGTHSYTLQVTVNTVSKKCVQYYNSNMKNMLVFKNNGTF